MKILILKITLYGVALALLTRATGFLLPDGWENDQYSSKLNYLRSVQPEKFNTVFFGSSRTYSQVDPILFDSLNALAGVPTRSFVAASSSSFFLETQIRINTLLAENVLNGVDHVLIELDQEVLLEEEDLFKAERAHYINPGTLSFALHALSGEHPGTIPCIRQLAYFVTTAMVSLTEFGHGRKKLAAFFRSEHTYSDYDWYARHGHRGLDSSNPDMRINEFRVRHQGLVSDTAAVSRIMERITTPPDMAQQYHINAAVRETYLHLAERLNKAGISVCFVLPLRGTLRPEDKILFQSLPEHLTLDMSREAAAIPQLHYASYWFDRGHVNVHGVKLYTKAFSEAWLRHKEQYGNQIAR